MIFVTPDQKRSSIRVDRDGGAVVLTVQRPEGVATIRMRPDTAISLGISLKTEGEKIASE